MRERQVSGKTEVDPSDDGAGDRHVVNVVLSPFHSLVRLGAALFFLWRGGLTPVMHAADVRDALAQ